MNLITADFGGKMWDTFDGSSHRSLSPDQFLRIEQWCPPKSMLGVERAHLGCARTEKSLAQVYDAETLQDFYRRAYSLGIDIRFFPQSQTPKARAQTGFIEKNDEADSEAIHAYLLKEPSVCQSLQRPPHSFVAERWREAGWAFKDETNAILNVARRFDYKVDGDQITAFVLDNLERLAVMVPDDTKEIFGLLHRKKDGSFYAIDSKQGNKQGPKLTHLYTLASLLLNDEGELRLRPDTSQPPGINWLMRTQLATSPYHHRGGIARSNVMWHGFKNYVVSKMNTRKAGPSGKLQSHYSFTPEQTTEFRQHRKTYLQAHRIMLSAMKSLLV